MAKFTKKEAPTPEKKQTAPAEQYDAGKSWYTRGAEGMERKKQIDEVARMRKEKGIQRFYLKHTPGQHEEGEPLDNEARLVFLDNDGFFVFEHNLKLEGRWGNFFTCVKDFKPCDVCSQLNDKPVYTCYYTVIDTRKFVRKDGTVSKNRKILFPAKGAAIDIINNIRQKHGNLRGLIIDVKRSSDRDPNCGRDFDVVMKDGKIARIDPTKKFEDSAPYEYMKVLAPPSAKELEAAGVHVAVAVGSDEDIEPTKTVETVAAGGDDDLSLLGD